MKGMAPNSRSPYAVQKVARGVPVHCGTQFYALSRLILRFKAEVLRRVHLDNIFASLISGPRLLTIVLCVFALL